MKKERYLRHELERTLIAYAIAPAVIFTLVCGLLSMTVLFHGKKGDNIKHSRYVAGLLDNVLTRYEDGVREMASQPDLLDRVRDQNGKVELPGIFYGITNSLGLEDDLSVTDSSRNILLSNRSDLPPFLDVPEGVSWGIFDGMNREPNRTAPKLAEGWENDGNTIIIRRSVMDGNKEQGHILRSIPSSQSKALVDRSDIQTIIADPFGWVYANSNYNFLNNSNQIMKIFMELGRYLNHKKQMYLASGQRAPKGGFTMYSISNIQNTVISLSLGSGLVITVLMFMTLWIPLDSREATEIETEDFCKILGMVGDTRDGDLEDVIQMQSDNEFKIIADAYNETIQSLRIQMENNRKVAELVSMAQNRQLESQFNPHFLYNILKSIRYICKLEPAIMGRMVFSLPNLLCHSLDGSKAEVTLKEDLEHLKSYLTILRRRLGERFRRRIGVEPEIMDLWIPKLVLQPMIENVVKYGSGKQLNLAVELEAYIYEGKLITIYRNDGVGTPQCTLSELTALLEQKENPRRYPGLYNIHRRIDTLYGCLPGVEIRSAEGHDTTLVVTPSVKREESDGCCVC